MSQSVKIIYILYITYKKNPINKLLSISLWLSFILKSNKLVFESCLAVTLC